VSFEAQFFIDKVADGTATFWILEHAAANRVL
jgi:hypothetical protein